MLRDAQGRVGRIKRPGHSILWDFRVMSDKRRSKRDFAAGQRQGGREVCQKAWRERLEGASETNASFARGLVPRVIV